MGLICLIWLICLICLMGPISLISLINLISLICLICLMGPISPMSPINPMAIVFFPPSSSRRGAWHQREGEGREGLFYSHNLNSVNALVGYSKWLVIGCTTCVRRC